MGKDWPGSLAAGCDGKSASICRQYPSTRFRSTSASINPSLTSAWALDRARLKTIKQNTFKGRIQVRKVSIYIYTDKWKDQFAAIFWLQHVATKFLDQKEEEMAMVESQQWAPQNQSSRYIQEDPNTSIRRILQAQIFWQLGAAVTHPFSKDLVHSAHIQS